MSVSSSRYIWRSWSSISGRRIFPQATLDGLQQAFDDAAQRPGVAPPEEFLHVGIEHVLFGDVLVHPVLDYLRGGVVAEHVIHGGGQLESALVAVALHGLHPLGINHATAENAACLVLEIPDPGARRDRCCRRRTGEDSGR